MKYTTVQGDTFDLVAANTLGSENLMDKIIDANPSLAATIVFGAGVILNIPEIIEKAAVPSSAAPPWRKKA